MSSFDSDFDGLSRSGIASCSSESNAASVQVGVGSCGTLTSTHTSHTVTSPTVVAPPGMTSSTSQRVVVKETSVSSNNDLLKSPSYPQFVNTTYLVSHQQVCVICGDRCLGYHYSVLSCEGCKGFFKRTAQMNLAYTCKYSQTCMVDKTSRNACQYCRFQKCLKSGMKREAVRDDRTSGGKHSSKRLRVREGNCEESSFKPHLSPLLDMEHQKIIDIIMASQPDRIPCRNGSISSKDIGIQEQLDCGSLEVKFVIQWAKKVPYFNTLTVVDQMALLKSTFLEINMLRLCYRSMKYPNCMYFADGIVLDRTQIKTLGWGNELVQMSMDFTNKLRAVQLNDVEYALMKVIVLTYPDAIGLVDKQSVIKIQTRFLDTLSRYVSAHYPHDKCRLGKLLMRLPALRMFGAKAQENVLILSLEGAVQIDELIREMML